MSIFLYIRKYILYLAILQLLGYKCWGLSGKYPIQNFTPTEYKAGIQNIDFAQNRNMTLFVANNLGILSYNGNEWKTHDFKTGKKKRSLAFDEHQDRLYMGAQSDFGYFEADWKYVSLIDKIPAGHEVFDEVWDVFLVQSTVYFCTFQGIYIYDGQTIKVITQEGDFERSFLANGKIFTQNQQGKLFEIVDQKLVSKYPQNHTNEIIAGIIPQEEGYLLIYNSGQIEQTSTFGVAPRYKNLAAVLKGSFVNHVLQLSDNRLAISTQRSGLFLFDLQKEKIEHISTQEGLGSNSCLRSYQDYYGNLWVGMQNGIALIPINSPMRLLSQEINIQGSGYEAFETPMGTYYTTSNGIYFLEKNAAQCVFLMGTEGPAYGIQEVAGKYYAGHHTGLFLLEEKRARRITNTDGLWQVKQLRSRPEFVIGGTYSGLFLFKIDNNRTLVPVQKIKGFDDSSRFMEEDQQGNIWVGQYYKGLYQLLLSQDLTSVEVKNLSENSKLPIQEQIVLSSLNDGLYVATNQGMYQLDPMTEQLEKAELFSDKFDTQPIYLAAQDRRNNIHIVAENQAAYYKQISTNNYQFVPSSLYQMRYHLNNDLLHLSLNISEGILFSANDGFIHYDPTMEIAVADDNPLIIKRVFSLGHDKELYAQSPFAEKPQDMNPLTLKSGVKVLKIEVESFQLNGLGKQSFRYLLEGLDQDYGEWTTSGTKEYTNLEAGNYIFRVQTRNYLGEIISSQALYIKLKPPVYKSRLAKIIYAGLVFFLFFQIFAFQRRSYQRKTNKIAASKQLEIEEEQKKLVLIEQQKEEEVQHLKEEKMQSELQHVNKLLAASTMNLVVKNEFIESIKEELNEVRQKGKKAETKQALEKLIKEIDINLRIQEDWEQFEYHFDAVHGDFLSRLRMAYPELSPNEQKLCAFLRLNLNTKDIANLLGISLRGVEVARYRLRKKLDLDRGQNLSKYILEY